MKIPRPSIADFLNIAGVLFLIAAFVSLLAALVNQTALLFGIALAFFVSALIYFGFAHVIIALAQIVANTSQKTGPADHSQYQQGIEELIRVRQAIEKIHGDNIESNKALQWIIDNWRAK